MLSHLQRYLSFFLREVYGHNEKLGSRAPSCHTCLVADSAQMGRTCAQVGKLAGSLWGPGSVARLTVALPSCQAKSVCACLLVVENLVVANVKPKVASAQCILKLQCLSNICI